MPCWRKRQAAFGEGRVRQDLQADARDTWQLARADQFIVLVPRIGTGA